MSRSQYDYLQDAVEEAVRNVIEAFRPMLKRRKKSKALLLQYVLNGARNAVNRKRHAERIVQKQHATPDTGEKTP